MEKESGGIGPAKSNEREAEVPDLLSLVASVLEQGKRILATDWKNILGVTVIVAIVAILATYGVTPMYKATVVAQVKGKSTRGGSVSPLADLALAAGVPVPADETADAAIGKLESDSFARSFIAKEKLVDSLLSHKSWFLSGWLTLPTLMPSNAHNGISDEYRNLERAREILTKRTRITADKKTQLLTLDFYWDDPVKAAELANKMIRQVNDYMRKQAVDDSNRSIAYLNLELTKTSLVPLQQAIYRLMEEQIKTQMTAGVSEEFALRFIDPASPPIQRDSPRRLLIATLAAILGSISYMLLLILRTKASRHI